MSNARSRIKDWKTILQRFEELDSTNARHAILSLGKSPKEAMETITEFTTEMSEYFCHTVLPIFIKGDIQSLISGLEATNPWVLEFTNFDLSSSEFPDAISQFQEDPKYMPEVLADYETLHNYQRMRSSFVALLRYWSYDTLVDHTLVDDALVDDALVDDALVDDALVENAETAKNAINVLTSSMFEASESGDSSDLAEPVGPTMLDDGFFITQVTAVNKRIVYYYFRGSYYQKNPGDIPRQFSLLDRISYRLTLFVRLLPPRERTENTSGFSRCIEILRQKAVHHQLQTSPRVRELLEENARLREELQTKDEYLVLRTEEIARTRLVLSDLSFRHLFEMLPVAKEAYYAEQENLRGKNQHLVVDEGNSDAKKKKKKKSAIKAMSHQDDSDAEDSKTSNKTQDTQKKQLAKSTPQWQAFWREAWKRAGESSADSTNPLDKLWHKYESKPFRQTQILSTGENMYGVMSANIHEFGSQFDPKRRENTVLDELLKALQPDKENIGENGNVDWDKEWKRWLPPKI